jgi:hypothetical protein
MAVELVGAWAPTHPEAATALRASADGDPSPAVRKKAAWYAPGGTIYRQKAARLLLAMTNAEGAFAGAAWSPMPQ